jgi:hypothetical protein
MSDVERPRPPQWFRRLARRGAFLAARPGGADLFTSDDGAAPAATIDGGEIAAALAAGWLEPIGAGRLRPSRQGIAALRAALGDVSGATAPRTSAPLRLQRRTDRIEINPLESPLGWLRSRRDKNGNPLISEAEFDAGERLRADFWFAQMTPKVTSGWSGTLSSRRSRRSAPGTGVEIQDSVVAARERVRRALEAVGPELSGILIDVCCHLNGLEEAERSSGWPQRSGKVVLQIALVRLARHYGLLPPDRPRSAAGGRIRHWGAGDYKPTAEMWS